MHFEESKMLYRLFLCNSKWCFPGSSGYASYSLSTHVRGPYCGADEVAPFSTSYSNIYVYLMKRGYLRSTNRGLVGGYVTYYG